jgi:starch synthase
MHGTKNRCLTTWLHPSKGLEYGNHVPHYWQRKHRKILVFFSYPSVCIKKFMEIVHLSAEFAPVAKVGGLGDALFGLSRAQAEHGNTVEIILPKYATLKLDEIEDLKVAIHNLSFSFDGAKVVCTIWKGLVHGINVTLIEAHAPYTYFQRDSIYGFDDDHLRFAYFSKAALEYLLKEQKTPDVIHLHDWHSALAAPLYRSLYAPQNEKKSKLVLTIHNLFYQGICSADLLEKLSLESKLYHQIDQLQDGYVKGHINLLKGGVVNCDFITTVSPSYAREILDQAPHNHIAEVLNKNRFKFEGILNGIDYGYWDPTCDPYLSTHFSIKDLKVTPPFIEGKRKLKTELRQMLGLLDEEIPMVSVVTRLVSQKGIELIKHALLRTLERGGQFVLIGSTQEKETLARFTNLKKAFENSPYVHIELGYNEKLSHLVYAASDLFLVPSLFEPCGLTQMIAMRYGTLPLVRQTGGLADSVFDEINGFVFGPPTFEAIQAKLDIALDVWFHHPALFAKIIHGAMSCNYSWSQPAAAYLDVYSKIQADELVTQGKS